MFFFPSITLFPFFFYSKNSIVGLLAGEYNIFLLTLWPWKNPSELFTEMLFHTWNRANRGCLFSLSFQKDRVVCIAFCWNVRKGLRKEIAGTYLNLALYFCVFSKYLRNCADTMSPPYLFTYWNATSLNYGNACWVVALTVTNFSICQWSFKWLLKFF